MEETNIEFIYSTPQIYVDAVANEQIEWPTKYDDMFPYADNDAGYWTGYFTSRPNDKKYFRDGSHTLHAANKIFAMEGLNQRTTDAEIEEFTRASKNLWDAVGTVQHHDGITGTAKQHVSDDYKTRIFKNIEATNQVYVTSINKISQDWFGFENQDWQWCSRTNATWTDCPIAAYHDSTDLDMLVATHNPASVSSHVIELKVPHPHFKVSTFDSADNKWVDAKADVICHVQQQELYPDETVDDCVMNVEQTIGGGEIGFTRVKFDKEHNLIEASCVSKP